MLEWIFAVTICTLGTTKCSVVASRLRYPSVEMCQNVAFETGKNLVSKGDKVMLIVCCPIQDGASAGRCTQITPMIHEKRS